jgi:glycosyltransferase involved in cell wall biosynthesis
MVLPAYAGRSSVIESVWLQSAHLGRSLGARLGGVVMLTPAGLMTPEEVEENAVSPDSQPSSARAVASRWPQLALLASETRSWWRARRFRRTGLRLTRDHHYSLVVEIHRRHHTTGEAIARRKSLPYLRRVEALEIREEAEWGVRRPLWGHLVEVVGELTPIKRAQGVAVISSVLDAELASAGVPAERRCVLPSAVDTNVFLPGAKDEELLREFGMDGRFVVGWIGGFRPFHGLDVIPRLARALAEQLPDVMLCLVGTGPLYDEVEKSVRGLHDTVRLVGAVPHAEVVRWIRSFDTCLLLANPGAFHYSPLKLYEYMGCGRAVVAASVGEIPDLIKNEVNGMLVRPRDVDAIVEVIRRLRDDTGLRTSLGDRARERVASRGSWDARATDVVEWLQRRDLLTAQL